MGAQLLSGKEVSEAMLARVLEDSEMLIGKGIIPTLAIFRIGEDPGSISYEKSIITRMAKSKIEVKSVVFDLDVTQDEFVAKIKEANADKNINGILIFKPLPPQINEDEIKYMIAPEKDPDALNPTNLGKLMIMDNNGFFPCTAEGVMELLNYYNIDVKGKDVTIINNSNVFGKPLAIMLTNEFATVSICHIFTKSCKDYTLKSDIVITGCGVYGLLTPDMVREDAIVIDVAMAQKKDANKQFVLDENGKKIRTGDCREDMADACAMLTSATPGCGGGTGPITTALLAQHLIKGCKLQNGIE